MHDKMLDNPFDMSNTKYQPDRPVSSQRDQNPLGHPLKKESVWLTKQEKDKQAKDLLSGKNTDQYKQQNMDLYNKYQKYVYLLIALVFSFKMSNETNI